MIHGYDPEIAIDVGVVAAVLYKNIQYWCEKNRANEVHLHDGHYWTYNSVKAYRELFPEFTEQQVRNALKKLCEKEYIKIGNYNKDGRDRTRWFADLHPIINNIEATETTDCICENTQMQVKELTSAVGPETEPLPNNYQITTTNNNKKERKKAESTMTTFNEILDSSDLTKNNPELREAIIDFIKMRQRCKKPLTDRALKENINDAFALAHGDPNKMTQLFVQSIKNGWQGIWELKDNTAPAPRTTQQASENPYYKRLEERGLA